MKLRDFSFIVLSLDIRFNDLKNIYFPAEYKTQHIQRLNASTVDRTCQKFKCFLHLS